MKKPLIAFAVVFAILFGLFATIGIQQINTNAAIAKAPAYVLATPEGITKKTKKSRETFQVNFTYAVAGTTYKIDSDWMSTVAEAEALAATPVQIAYAASAPADGVFKSDFDKRDVTESVPGAVSKAAGLGFLLAIFATLFLIWKFPVLRRTA
jgi:hypothetical protein